MVTCPLQKSKDLPMTRELCHDIWAITKSLNDMPIRKMAHIDIDRWASEWGPKPAISHDTHGMHGRCSNRDRVEQERSLIPKDESSGDLIDSTGTRYASF